jgi:serine/tyrosine/threonine adenylyltransferase
VSRTPTPASSPTPSNTSLPPLGTRFATALPELSIPWRAEEVDDPRLLVLNEPLAAELGLDADWLRGPEGLRFLAGNEVPETATPVAQAYAGHQFGMFVPRLGDGRALLLGELEDRSERPRDVHLKGSGPTPFARGGDGLAAQGPMLREYLVSEAMHALGLPTTRALAVVGTGRTVRRDDGGHPGALLVRVAASHLRVGSFEYARGLADTESVRRLADFAIERHHPGPRPAPGDGTADAGPTYRGLLDSVLRAQAELVAGWLLVGFVHGVMNTDNMAISGETIDYGPCAFLDAFDPAAVFSSIDTGGRYAYGRQPAIAQWNLARFAETLLPLLDPDPNEAVESAQQALAAFPQHFGQAWTAGMRRKLGLPPEVGDDVAGPLADELLGLLAAGRTDYTSFFRRLGRATRDGGSGRGTSGEAGALFGMVDGTAAAGWLGRWRALGPDPAVMDGANPAYIPRNHLVEEALAAAESGAMEPFRRLLGAVSDPYRERPGLERYASPAPADFGPYVTYCGT